MNEEKVPDKLLEVLACPACSKRPRVEMAENGLRCPQCGRVYPVQDGIPIMLVDKAIGAEGEETSEGNADTRPEP